MSIIKTLIARHKTIWLIFFAVITFLMVILNVSSRYGQDNELMYFYMPPPFYQLDSESLVCDPILAIINGKEIDQNTFGLGVLCKEDTSQTVFYTDLLVEDPNLNNDYIYEPYISQLGLQGFIFCGITRLFQNSIIIAILRMLCAAIFSMVMLAIVIELYRKYGLLYAIVFWGVSMLSNWICSFALNLYWVEFTWFIPMLLGLLCLNHAKLRKMCYFLFFISILFKCLCGFEYLSTIMVSGEVFLALEWFFNKEQRKPLFKCMLISGLCMLAGFIVAVIIMVCIYGQGDLFKGLNIFRYYLVERRTFGNSELYSNDYSESLNASLISVVLRYTFEFITGTRIMVIFIASLIVMLVDHVIFKHDRKPEFLLAMLQLIAAMSWFILAKSHSYIHININFVLYYMGFVQTIVYCLINTVIRRIKSDMVNKIQNKLC